MKYEEWIQYEQARLAKAGTNDQPDRMRSYYFGRLTPKPPFKPPGAQRKIAPGNSRSDVQSA